MLTKAVSSDAEPLGLATDSIYSYEALRTR